MKILFTLTITLMLFVVSSCNLDFDPDNLSSYVEQETDLVMPVLNANFTLDDLLPDNDELDRYLQADNDGFLTLTIEQEIDAFTAEDFFDNNMSGPIIPYYSHTIDPQIFEIGMENFLDEGEFYLADPRVTIIIKNYWDVPGQFRFQDFAYHESADSPGTPMTGDVFNTWIPVERPSSFGAYAITTVEMNNTNSNVTDMISAMPHHLTLGATIETIPTDISFNIPTGSVDSVKFKLEVPMDLRITNIVLQDTVDFTVTEDLDSDTSIIETVTAKIAIDNGFPLDIRAQIYMLDKDYNIIDQINADGINVASAQVSSGDVTQSQESNITITLDDSKVGSLKNTRYLMPYVVFNTANNSTNETVKFYTNYNVGIKMGMRVQARLEM